MSHHDVAAAGAVATGASGQPSASAGPLRWAVNLWLVFHLAAIIIAPAAVGPVVRPRPRGVGLLPALSRGPLPQPRLPLLRPRAGGKHAPVVRGGAARRDRRPRPDPRPGRSAPTALPPLFHAHRTHAQRTRGAPQISGIAPTRSTSAASTGPRRVSLIQQTHLLPTQGEDPGGRATDRPGELRGPSAGGLSDATIDEPGRRLR